MFNFIDLFAGIGGFRLGLEPYGGKCVFSCEIDPYAAKTYQAWHGDDPIGDITILDPASVPDHDILTGGFVCKSFSIAGVSKKKSLGVPHGFDDPKSGELFFYLANIIEAKQPKIFILENVKNLVSHNQGKTFKIILNILNDFGYQVSYKVIDAQYWVPQHRERVLIVGLRTSYFDNLQFEFPTLPESNKLKIKDILEKEVPEKYTLSNHLWDYLQKRADLQKKKGNGFGFGLVNLDGITRTLSARYHKDGAEILIPQVGKNPRRLTPREAARLMGYPDHLPIVVSDTRAYQQFGNAIVPALIRWVTSSLEERKLLP